MIRKERSTKSPKNSDMRLLKLTEDFPAPASAATSPQDLTIPRAKPPRVFATLVAAEKKHCRTNPIRQPDEMKAETIKKWQFRHGRGSHS
jgi:hypothetical protein